MENWELKMENYSVGKADELKSLAKPIQQFSTLNSQFSILNSQFQWNNPQLKHLTTMPSRGLFHCLNRFHLWLTSLSTVWCASLFTGLLPWAIFFELLFLCITELGAHLLGLFYLYIGITSSCLYYSTAETPLQDGIFHKDKGLILWYV